MTDLPQLPFARRDPFDVSPTYRELRAERPIAQVRTLAGDVAWVVSGYEDTRQLLADDRLGRSHPQPERAARISNSAIIGGPQGDFATEKATHERMRRLLAPAFSRRRMNALGAHVQEIVDDLLDRIAAQSPPVDLHEALSFPLPALVICELLGVPYEDRDKFRALSNEVADLADADKSAAAHEQLGVYMYGLLVDKRRAPGEDVLSDLATADEADLDEVERIRMAVALLFAGHETTVTRIDFGTVLLLSHPDQLAALRDDPALVPQAVEEILRVAAPSDHGLTRYAREDIEFGDVTIKAGDAVLLVHHAANRDEKVFPEPDTFNIFRAQPEPHLGFGHAQHFCLGASLARVELRSVFSTMFQRFPTLELAVPVEELRRPVDRLTGGFVELPVTWKH
jgi:cytochrome P450